jgi:hypothetical protein
MRKSPLIRKILLAGVVPLLATMAINASASTGAAASVVPPGPPASAVFGVPTLKLVLESHSDVPMPGGVQPLNASDGFCPNQTTGTNCTVVWISSHGTSSAVFEYYVPSTGQLGALPPYFARCNYTTCTFGLTGGGPGVIATAWVVYGGPGQTVSIISITEP